MSFTDFSMPAQAARIAAKLGPRIGLVAITSSALLWSTTGTAGVVLNESAGLCGLAIAFYRLLFAGIFLLALSGRMGLRKLTGALRRAPLLIVVAGVCLGAYQALFFSAVTLVGVGVATLVCLGVAPVLLFGWEALSSRRRPSPARMLVLLLAVSGLALVSVSTGSPTASAPKPALGLILAFAAGIVYAGVTVASRHAVQNMPAMTLTTATTVIGALALAPFALADGLAFNATAGAVAVLLYLGIAATALSYGLFYFGLRGVESSVAAIVTLLEPLAAAALAVVILQESFSLPALCGGVLMLTAVALLYAAPRRRSATESDSRCRVRR